MAASSVHGSMKKTLIDKTLFPHFGLKKVLGSLKDRKPISRYVREKKLGGNKRVEAIQLTSTLDWFGVLNVLPVLNTWCMFFCTDEF
ncbi:hypothetical protein V6N12_023842 [Hibiscus sabdariffa]|uniref:Uncharacterized protein n=1 Tax=Hibiscus sabdariffa TaxID=183260 RepID=A0ABR2FYV4_9ROSI